MPIDKPQKPSSLLPRSFGGEKNNFSDDLIASGFEPNTRQTYNGDNLNYQLDATGKELDYCEKVVDYINGLGVGKTPIVNANNKLDETQVGVKVYNATETFGLGEWVKGTVDDVVGLHESLKPANVGNALTDATSWKKVKFGDEGANIDLSNLSTTGQAKFDEKVDLNLANSTPTHDFATKLNNAQIHTIIKTYQNGTSWYRVWSDGWCEQGGKTIRGTTVNFLKVFKDTNYTIVTNCDSFSDNATGSSASELTQSSFVAYAYSNNTGFVGATISWQASGYIN